MSDAEETRRLPSRPLSHKEQQWKSTGSQEPESILRVVSAEPLYSEHAYHSLVLAAEQAGLLRVTRSSAALVQIPRHNILPREMARENGLRLDHLMVPALDIEVLAIAERAYVSPASSSRVDRATRREFEHSVVLHKVIPLRPVALWNHHYTVGVVTYSGEWSGMPDVLTNDPTGVERCTGCKGCLRNTLARTTPGMPMCASITTFFTGKWWWKLITLLEHRSAHTLEIGRVGFNAVKERYMLPHEYAYLLPLQAKTSSMEV